MKLSTVTATDIKKATKIIDDQGVPKDMVWNNYFVLVDGKEYPFKHLTRIAAQFSKVEPLDFVSNDSYRAYIENLGFKINYYKEGINFFTKEELEYYSSIVNKKYQADNKAHKNFSVKLYPIIAKANLWADRLMSPGFKLVKADKWLNAHSSTIKEYFWPRIYKGIDQDIFFNVEVNGAEQFVGIKLDGYYETKKKLPPYKITILEEYKEAHSIVWLKIPFSELSKYDWDRLLAETSNYVARYLANHDQLKDIISKDIKIARITWNTNNWVKPSGRIGKSTNTSFEKEQGYGHEEWLFSSDSVIDGYKYGFLEPVHKHRATYEGKNFDILLYTRNTETNQYYWVAKLENVEVIERYESEQVLKIYKDKGWYDRMRLDLFDYNLDSKHLDNWVKVGADQLFNIKFTATQLQQIPPDLIPFVDFAPPSDRYTLMDATDKMLENFHQSAEGGFSIDTGSDKLDPLGKGVKKYEKKEVEIPNKHNEIQGKFLKYLKKNHKGKKVKVECHAHGSSRIDITQETSTGYIFYEIKAYNNLRTSIREALGQLLEYCLYPDAQYAEKIVLVSDQPPTGPTRTYLKHVKLFLKIPFYYIHFDTVNEVIVEEI